MKTITLKKLTLQDWRGQNKTVEFGKETLIKGRNKSGKSSVFNSFLWLLTGCDEQNRQNYKLFNDTLPLTFENSKLASVEAVVTIDGCEYTFKRTAKPGWTRKRGREEYEKSATDNYSFSIDYIERNATEYKKFIEENFAPIEKLKLIMNIRHYQSLEYKELRKHFEDLIGEISINDFKGDYSTILADLNKYSIQEVKSSYKSRIKVIKEKKDALPTVIETLQANLPDISGLDTIQAEIDNYKKQIADIDKELLGASESVQVYIDKRNAELKVISELEKEYAEAESQYNLKPIEEANKIKAEINGIEVRNNFAWSQNKSNEDLIKATRKELELSESTLEKLKEYRNTLLARNEEVKSMQFGGEVCSYCGQPLQGDKLEEAKRKFYEQRDAKHKAIVAEGKANNEKIAKCQKDIESYKAFIEKGYTEFPMIDTKELEQKLADLRANFVKYSQTIEGKEKVAKIENLKANLTSIPEQDNSGKIKVKQMLLDEIEASSKKLGNKERYDEQMLQISEKQKELRDSAIELARIEGMLNKVVAYEQERAEIVSNRVNGMFDYINVVMTSVNKSGDIVPDCRILNNEGISASVCNTESKVRCGVDLSLGLQKFYGINMPIFYDDSELINESNYPKIENQVVKLVVSDSEFSVEVKE